MKALKKISSFVIRAERAVAAITCIAIIVMVFTTVILRYIFKSQIAGMEEMILTAAFVIYFIGSSIGAYEESEITADMMSLFLKKPRSLALARAIRSLVEAGLMLVASYWAWMCIMDAAKTGKVMVMTKIPFTIEYGIVFIGLALTTVYSIGHFVNYTKKFITNDCGGEEAKA